MLIDFKDILKDVKPSKEDKLKVEGLSRQLMSIINQAARDESVDAEVVILGSVAKGTWLSGKGDIDLFIKFPLNTPLDYLKSEGLKLGYECIRKMKGESEERYASHPYITGHIDGYEVDIVPCYDIKHANELTSAVDRTILHTEYIKEELKDELKDDVMLLKRFMEMVGCYGSEFKVGGFAGYLCELLVIRYCSFLGVLKAATDWKPGHQIDLKGYGTASQFKDPLVVVDPTDKNRNVAAALTLQKMAEFSMAARNFLKNPKKSYFYPKKIDVNIHKIISEFEKRGSKTFIITFQPPHVPADALHPQIKKTEKSMVKILKKDGFMVMGSDSWSDEDKNVVILLELVNWHLPLLKKHTGPYVWYEEHVERFQTKHPDAWIEGDQLVVMVKRDFLDAESLIRYTLSNQGIRRLRVGKHLKDKILSNYHLDDVQNLLATEDVGNDLLEFMHHYLYRNEFLER